MLIIILSAPRAKTGRDSHAGLRWGGRRTRAGCSPCFPVGARSSPWSFAQPPARRNKHQAPVRLRYEHWANVLVWIQITYGTVQVLSERKLLLQRLQLVLHLSSLQSLRLELVAHRLVLWTQIVQLCLISLQREEKQCNALFYKYVVVLICTLFYNTRRITTTHKWCGTTLLTRHYEQSGV